MAQMNKLGAQIMLEDIRSALNVGAVFRTCDGAGVDKLLLSGITPYPPHNRIPKTALGAVDYVAWSHYKNKSEALAAAKEFGPIVAVELTESAIDLYEYKFPDNCTVVMGNEITGVSDEAIQISDAVVKVPMYGKKESLNVATTTGIIIYEIVRQRHYNG